MGTALALLSGRCKILNSHCQSLCIWGWRLPLNPPSQPHTHQSTSLPMNHNSAPCPTEAQNLFKPSSVQSSSAYFQALMRIPFITPVCPDRVSRVFFNHLFSACSWMRAPQTPTVSLLCSPSFLLSFMVKIDLCPVGVVKLPATALSSLACLVCGILTGAPYRRVYPFSLLRPEKFFSDLLGLLIFCQYWSIHFCSSLLILPSLGPGCQAREDRHPPFHV